MSRQVIVATYFATETILHTCFDSFLTEMAVLIDPAAKFFTKPAVVHVTTVLTVFAVSSLFLQSHSFVYKKKISTRN